MKPLSPFAAAAAGLYMMTGAASAEPPLPPAKKTTAVETLCDNANNRFCQPAPEDVTYKTEAAPGSIVIDTYKRRLYLITGPGTARAYPIAIGKTGMVMSGGTYRVERKKEFADWYPTERMRRNDPKLPVRIAGGDPKNPLGTRTIYFATLEGEPTMYRAHGTIDRKSIGKAASSGCFRMFNEDVEDLYERVSVGVSVTVLAPVYKPRPAYVPMPTFAEPDFGRQRQELNRNSLNRFGGYSIFD